MASAGPTPEGMLLTRARKRHRPRLPIRRAAARAGVSESLWRSVESGYTTPAAGVRLPKAAPAETYAQMAQAVGVTPEEIAALPAPTPEDGKRLAEAAGILRDLIASGDASHEPQPPARWALGAALINRRVEKMGHRKRATFAAARAIDASLAALTEGIRPAGPSPASPSGPLGPGRPWPGMGPARRSGCAGSSGLPRVRRSAGRSARPPGRAWTWRRPVPPPACGWRGEVNTMTRRRTSDLHRWARELQRDSYLVQRTAGDLAAATSPDRTALARRLIRRRVTRSLFRTLTGR